MLTYADEGTIHNAIWKRLHEPGKTEIADIQIINKPDASPPHIQVGIWLVLIDRVGREGLIDPRSFFDLPAEFEHSHLLNEIDEIAEQLKVIRQETKLSGLVYNPSRPRGRHGVIGTGLRGRWRDGAASRSPADSPKPDA